MLFDATVDGRSRSRRARMRQVRLVLRHRPRERQAAVPHRRSRAARQNTYAAAVSAEGVRVVAGRRRRGERLAGVLRPGSGVVYVASPACPGRSRPGRASRTCRAGRRCSKPSAKPVPAGETWGTLTALDLTNGGRVLWQVKTPQPLVGGTLATARRPRLHRRGRTARFDAYDAATGSRLWSTRPAPMSAPRRCPMR